MCKNVDKYFTTRYKNILPIKAREKENVYLKSMRYRNNSPMFDRSYEELGNEVCHPQKDDGKVTDQRLFGYSSLPPLVFQIHKYWQREYYHETTGRSAESAMMKMFPNMFLMLIIFTSIQFLCWVNRLRRGHRW